jgi:proline iminopeptidase
VDRTASVEVVEKMVDVDGVRLYTRRLGEGLPVVVLHGGPGAHHDYLLPQYDLLGRRRTLLYYDQRGGGRSPIARHVPAGWHEHVADLERLREQWRLERVTLLGYSWGGLLAVLYALEHPERIERLALVCPAPVAAAWRDDFQRRLAERAANPWIADARATLQESGLRERDPEKYRRMAFALSVAGYFRDPSIAQQLTPFRVTQRTEQAVWESLGRYDLRQRIASTFTGGRTPPSLVIAGAFDPLPIDAARELASLLGTTAVELDTGHVPHVEATEEFVRVLDAFLPHS